MFTTPADVRLLDQFYFELLDTFEYRTSDYVIQVPKGTITDLASVPRLLWAIFPPHGRYAKAAILHDYLYQNPMFDRAKIDLIFLESMNILGVKPWRKYLMYWSVRLFGRIHFNKRGL